MICIMVVVGCLFYNFAFKFIGGFEYESLEQKASNSKGSTSQ